jgi:hypothetical protein
MVDSLLSWIEYVGTSGKCGRFLEVGGGSSTRVKRLSASVGRTRQLPRHLLIVGRVLVVECK